MWHGLSTQNDGPAHRSDGLPPVHYCLIVSPFLPTRILRKGNLSWPNPLHLRLKTPLHNFVIVCREPGLRPGTYIRGTLPFLCFTRGSHGPSSSQLQVSYTPAQPISASGGSAGSTLDGYDGRGLSGLRLEGLHRSRTGFGDSTPFRIESITYVIFNKRVG